MCTYVGAGVPCLGTTTSMLRAVRGALHRASLLSLTSFGTARLLRRSVKRCGRLPNTWRSQQECVTTMMCWHSDTSGTL